MACFGIQEKDSKHEQHKVSWLLWAPEDLRALELKAVVTMVGSVMMSSSRLQKSPWIHAVALASWG